LGARIVTRCKEGVSGQAYCFHSYCWQSLESNEESKDLVTPAKLIHFARSTVNIYNLPESPRNVEQLHHGLCSLTEKAWKSVQTADSDLSVLLRLILKLPLEITRMIWKLLEPCAIRSLLIIESQFAKELLKHIDSVAPTKTEYKLDTISF
jgi:hypothetical protein